LLLYLLKKDVLIQIPNTESAEVDEEIKRKLPGACMAPDSLQNLRTTIPVPQLFNGCCAPTVAAIIHAACCVAGAQLGALKYLFTQ